MRRYFSTLKKGLGIVAVTSGVVGTLGFAYLQYINSILGPINVNKEDALQHYKNNLKLSDQQAFITYYWVIYKIAESRILHYHNYTSTCQKLKNKITKVALQNYQNENVFWSIDNAGSLESNKSQHQKIYNKAMQIRKKNSENIEERKYLIEYVKMYQKQFNSSVFPNLPEELTGKVDKIYYYIKEGGLLFNDRGVSKKTEKMKSIEKKFQKDFLFKTLLI